jgi:hypothetical protein
MVIPVAVATIQKCRNTIHISLEFQVLYFLADCTSWPGSFCVLCTDCVLIFSSSTTLDPLSPMFLDQWLKPKVEVSS